MQSSMENPPDNKTPAPHEALPTEAELESLVNGLYERLLKEPEIAEALDLLDKLPEDLVYHIKTHTLDVIRETILFAVADGASPEVIKQQAISAAWHDIGFVKQREENELIAVSMFRESKAYTMLSNDDAQETIRNIEDTTIVLENESPYLKKNKSSHGYALDGDVSNFGREDFFEKLAQVAEEYGIDLRDHVAKKKFYARTIALLKNHSWKTKSAQRMREAVKQKNLSQLEKEYAMIPSN